LACPPPLEGAKPRMLPSSFFAPSDAPPTSLPFILCVPAAAEAEAAPAGFMPKPPQELNFGFDMLQQLRPLTPADHHKLVYFEKLFFVIDSDSNGYVLLSEMERLLAFLALSVDDGERIRVLQALDDEADGLVQQDEFVQACCLLLWNVPQSQLNWAAQNFIEAVTTKTDRNTMYWRKAARQLDRLARVWIITAFLISISVVSSLHLYDVYDQPGTSFETKDGTSREMYEGLGPSTLDPLFLLAPIIVFVLLSVVLYQSCVGTTKQRMEKERLDALIAKINSVKHEEPKHEDSKHEDTAMITVSAA